MTIDTIPGPQGIAGVAGALFGTGVPDGADGEVLDIYVNLTTGIVYEKTGATTWTARFQYPVSVSNIAAFFVCPDGSTRGATLSD